MNRPASLCLVFLALVSGAVLLSANGCSGTHTTTTPPIPAGTIQHIVIIFQENRTPDNLFHDQNLITAGADIASSGLNSSQQTIQLLSQSMATTYDIAHNHKSFELMYDGGKMDGADLIATNCGTSCPPNPQYYYVDPSDVQPYFQLAEQYTFGDRMFQTNEGPSFPAHQFIISGTSAPTVPGASLSWAPKEVSTSFIADNADTGLSGSDTGCTAPANQVIPVVDANGNESSVMYPCSEHPALTDELDAKGISWRYYTPSAGSLWTAPNGIQHICGPNATPPNATTCTGSDWVNHVVLYSSANPAPILTDITNHQLPSVSWVIPAGQNSDHAGATTATGGPSWVASIVNAIGNSSYWANTAIIITWDDWGGWYDHVPPPKVINDGTSWGSGYVYGFRVPLIVVSPYAKAAYISHVNHDFGSILNFIEGTFGLASLGYADANTTDNLSDCFNFNQSPLKFQTIAAPLSADHFLNDRSPQTDPDDD